MVKGCSMVKTAWFKVVFGRKIVALGAMRCFQWWKRWRWLCMVVQRWRKVTFHFWPRFKKSTIHFDDTLAQGRPWFTLNLAKFNMKKLGWEIYAEELGWPRGERRFTVASWVFSRLPLLELVARTTREVASETKMSRERRVRVRRIGRKNRGEKRRRKWWFRSKIPII